MNKRSFLLLLTLSSPLFAMDRKNSVVRPSKSVLFIMDDEAPDASPAQAEAPIRADSAAARGFAAIVADPAETRAVAERLCAFLQNKPEMRFVSDGADFMEHVLGRSAEACQADEVLGHIDPALYPAVIDRLGAFELQFERYMLALADFVDSPSVDSDFSAMQGALIFCRDLIAAAKEKIQR